MIQFILGAIAAVGLSELSKRNKPKMADGGGVLSNKEKIVNLEFEDNTDRKLGRYDFSFETIDADGASILDYDGYIIESAAESRMPDNFEWGQNVPEDWENAEKYILDSFYEWKRSNGKYAKGGDVKGGKIYIEFLNKKKNFQIDRKYFNTDEEAMAWGRKNLGNFNIDMLRYEYADGGGVGNFSEYSNDALADMIVNLSRYEGNEDEIETIKAELSKRAASEFFSKLFQSRDIAHKEHLQTDSFAAHKALNEYYDGILPLVDGLVESYQGKYAKIEIADWNTDSKQPIIPYFESLLSYIDKNKDKAFTDSSLLNQVDEIKAMVQGTLYKLKELN